MPLPPLDGYNSSHADCISADGSLVGGVSFMQTETSTESHTAVVWRANGVARSVHDELMAAGIAVDGVLMSVDETMTGGLIRGSGRRDETAALLAWRAELP